MDVPKESLLESGRFRLSADLHWREFPDGVAVYRVFPGDTLLLDREVGWLLGALSFPKSLTELRSEFRVISQVKGEPEFDSVVFQEESILGVLLALRENGIVEPLGD